MSNIEIVPMKAEHIPVLAQLEKLCFSQPWSEKSLAEELDNRTAHFLAAVSDDVIMGYIGAFTVCESSYISNIAVFPQHRRKGIGRLLLRKAAEQARKKGAESISLEVRPSNTAAISLYKSEGYEEVGLRKNFYRDPNEDALILTLTFGND